MTDSCGFLSKICPVDRRDLAASIVFRIPIYRELCLWWGMVDASRAVAEKQLREKRSLLILVGGEHEQMHARPGTHKVVLRKRFGFIKLAMKSGCNLVPMYCWGENELFNTSSFLLKPRMWIQKKFGVALTFHFGQYGTPFIPLKKKMTLVYGKPIKVEKNENPSPEEVAKVLEDYVEKFTELFNNSKGYNTSHVEPVLEYID
jgi:1-acyl-sn-glycerol-3-phosphate acyltransferase